MRRDLQALSVAQVPLGMYGVDTPGSPAIARWWWSWRRKKRRYDTGTLQKEIHGTRENRNAYRRTWRRKNDVCSPYCEIARILQRSRYQGHFHVTHDSSPLMLHLTSMRLNNQPVNERQLQARWRTTYPRWSTYASR